MENLDQQEVESHMQLRNHIRHWLNFEAIDFIFPFLSEDYPGINSHKCPNTPTS